MTQLEEQLSITNSERFVEKGKQDKLPSAHDIAVTVNAMRNSKKNWLGLFRTQSSLAKMGYPEPAAFQKFGCPAFLVIENKWIATNITMNQLPVFDISSPN